MNNTNYKQYDTRWGGLGYPKKPYFIKGCGCGEVAICNTIIEMANYQSQTPATIQPYCKQYADPNGNGTADELAMFGSVNGYHTDILEYIINAWVYCNDEQPFNVDDGKVWLPYTTDEYRQAIIFLNQLFKEGLIPTQILSC